MPDDDLPEIVDLIVESAVLGVEEAVRKTGAVLVVEVDLMSGVGQRR